MTDTNTRAALTELIEAVEAAHTDLFRQCCSNPIKNAWGKEVSVLKLNEAAELARRFKSVHAAAPSLPAGDGLTDALREIKSLVCGDRFPRWGTLFATDVTRGKIADIVDEALAAPRQPVEVENRAITALIEKIEGMDFQCEGGPLHNCIDWQKLRALVCCQPGEVGAGVQCDGTVGACSNECSEPCSPASALTEAHQGFAGDSRRIDHRPASAQQDEREARPVKITDEHFSLLAMLQISSCHCGAKTPDAKYHESACQYRLACEIEDYLKAQQVQADAAADAREILPGWEFVARNSGEWVILPPTGDYWAASTSTPTGDLISAIVSARAAMTDQRTGGAENTAAITANSAVNSIGEVRA